MKKSDKILIIVMSIVMVVAIVSLCIFSFKDDIVIETYSAVIDVDSGGNVTVNERVEIDYREKKNERWRDIVVEKNHRFNPLYDDISSKQYINDKPTFASGEVVSVIKDGIDITNKVKIGYSYNNDVDKYGDPIKVPNNRNGESLYVDATNAGGLEGIVVFEYRYTINGMVTTYNDISELNYRLFEYMEGKVKYASVEVNLVKDTTDMNENDFYSYGHGISNGEIIQAINEDNNSYQYDYLITGKNIKSDDFFEFRLLFPNEVVSNINDNNIVNYDMKDRIVDYEYGLYIATRNQYIAAIVINVLTVCAIGLTGFLIYYAYKKYDKEYDASFDGDYYRELPNANKTPAEMSYLYYFGKTNDEDVTATMLDLIRKKVLILDTQGENINKSKPNFVIYLDREALNKTTLKIHEVKLVNWFINLIGDGQKVSFEEIENFGHDYNNAQKFQKYGMEFKKAVKDQCKNDNLFDKFSINGKQNALVKGLFIVALLIISLVISAMYNVAATINIIIMIILMVIYFVYVSSIKKRSVEANEEYVKWKAFKNFLEDFSSFEDYPIPGIVVWEEYLVYATSLKIADKVMEQLEVKLPECEESDTTYMRTYYHGYHYHPYFYIRSFNSTMTTARMNSISTIQAHNIKMSGGSGRGGGFTGGSSFGGGGGGGRSR